MIKVKQLLNTENITLRYNNKLLLLSEYVLIPVDKLMNLITNHLLLSECKHANGDLLYYILYKNNYDIKDFCRNVFCVWTPKLQQLLNCIYIHGLSNDCKSINHYNSDVYHVKTPKKLLIVKNLN
jgi:hypothetical protein